MIAERVSHLANEIETLLELADQCEAWVDLGVAEDERLLDLADEACRHLRLAVDGRLVGREQGCVAARDFLRTKFAFAEVDWRETVVAKLGAVA